MKSLFYLIRAEPRSTQNVEKYGMNEVPVIGARHNPAPIVLPVKCQHKIKNFWDQPVNIIILVAVLVALGVAVAALIDTKIRLNRVESKLNDLQVLSLGDPNSGKSVSTLCCNGALSNESIPCLS